MSSLPRLARRLHGFEGTTVWGVFTPLAAKHNAINLGQGYPGWPAPDFVKESMTRAVSEEWNQYTRPEGAPPLVSALADRYSSTLGRPIDAMTEVAVCVGASDALYACLQSLVDPGDEVVCLEPAFDLYYAQTKVAGGVCKFVPLRLTDAADGGQAFTLDMEELEAAFSDKTKVFLFNAPHNPTGRMFSEAEISAIADVLRKFPRAVVVSDEVYEHLTFDGRKHETLATLPDFVDRSIVVSSAGKTFSVTGWKCGWCVGAPDLIKGVVTCNQWVQFSVSTPTQHAVAYSMERASKPYEGFPTYYDFLRAEYTRKRDILMAALTDVGMRPVAPEGAFFIMADTSGVDIPEQYVLEGEPRDWAFCRYMTIEGGVAAIPPSSFYTEEDKHLATNLVRFCFAKPDEDLEEAGRRLKALFSK